MYQDNNLAFYVRILLLIAFLTGSHEVLRNFTPIRGDGPCSTRSTSKLVKCSSLHVQIMLTFVFSGNNTIRDRHSTYKHNYHTNLPAS